MPLLTYETRFHDVILTHRHLVWDLRNFVVKLLELSTNIYVIIQRWVDHEADRPPGAKDIKLNTESTDIQDRQLRQAANREG